MSRTFIFLAALVFVFSASPVAVAGPYRVILQGNNKLAIVAQDGRIERVWKVRAEADADIERSVKRKVDRWAPGVHRLAQKADIQLEGIAMLLDSDPLSVGDDEAIGGFAAGQVAAARSRVAVISGSSSRRAISSTAANISIRRA